MLSHDGQLGRVSRQGSRLFLYLADSISPFALTDDPPPNELVSFAKWALRGAKLHIFLTVLSSMMVGITTVVGFAMIGWLIDEIKTYGVDTTFFDYTQFAAFPLFYLVVWPLMMGLNAILTTAVLQPNLYVLILARINRYVTGHSTSFFQNDFAGRIAQKSQQAARSLSDVITETSNILGNAVAASLSAAALVSAVNWLLGVITILWTLAYALLLYRFLPPIREKSRSRAETRAAVSGQIVDTLSNIVTVKLFAHNEEARCVVDGALSTFRRSAINWATTVVAFRTIVFVLAGSLPAALVGISVWLWSQGNATVGDVAAAGLVSTRLAAMTGWVSFAALNVFSNIGEIEDSVQSLAKSHDVIDNPFATGILPCHGRIEFKDVSFSYRKGRRTLDQINFHIDAGEKVAFVGKSGGGKSTIISLLARFHDVEDGKITIDGIDIRDLAQAAHRGRLAIVHQEAGLFNRSALENIRYGRPDAADEEVFYAARLAKADGFIATLSDPLGRTGYNAHVGERGAQLSGGQRQRITLARAFLKNAPILVLDEATSALDSACEAEIWEDINPFMNGKTVIVITHRLTAVTSMDRIFVLDQGRIAQIGTHQDLVNMEGPYMDLWESQSRLNSDGYGSA
ncbi:ABC transporter ATP-binding protein [Agrobacterium tumefaciens]|uniref:ABC transporter ATP-binding protein n=1 Tax=Agrobacterium tumefaciens TaxID=358 RepID=UPI0009D6F3ED